MNTFRQYLVENDYPGGYYNQEGRLIQHFNNKEEKEEWDSNPHNDPNDELIYRSDKRMNVKKLLGTGASTVAKYTQPMASAALKAALGDGVLSEVPIEQIENNIDKLNEELRKVNQALDEIRSIYLREKDEGRKKALEVQFETANERRKQILAAKKRYEDNNYN